MYKYVNKLPFFHPQVFADSFLSGVLNLGNSFYSNWRIEDNRPAGRPSSRSTASTPGFVGPLQETACIPSDDQTFFSPNSLTNRLSILVNKRISCNRGSG